jgi:hypothetical protein
LIFSTARKSVVQVGAQGCERVVGACGAQGANRLDSCAHPQIVERPR